MRVFRIDAPVVDLNEYRRERERIARRIRLAARLERVREQDHPRGGSADPKRRGRLDASSPERSVGPRGDSAA